VLQRKTCVYACFVHLAKPSFWGAEGEVSCKFRGENVKAN
jgi:hypothetical protein